MDKAFVRFAVVHSIEETSNQTNLAEDAVNVNVQEDAAVKMVVDQVANPALIKIMPPSYKVTVRIKEIVPVTVPAQRAKSGIDNSIRV